MKRILFIGDKNSPHFTKWIKPLEKCEQEILFAAFDVHENKFRIYKVLNLFIYFLKTFQLLLINKVDGIHLHYLGIYSIPAIILSAMFRKPLFITIWGSDVNFESSKISYLIKKIALKRSIKIFCDAEHIVEKVKAYNISNEKIEIFEFGIDVSSLNQVYFKRKKHTVTNKVRVYANRRHEDIYNNELVIDIFEKIQERYPDSSINIAATGSLTNRYKKIIDIKRLRNVNFTGAFTRKQLLEQLAETDIYISASNYDAGLATSVVEAMCAGTLCVVSDVLDNSRIAVHKQNAILFSEKKLDTLLDDLDWALQRNNYRTITGNANAVINEKMNINYWARMIADVHEVECEKYIRN